eukprot:TRINITY_DN9359_c0_g1_i1.p2 TRINITY_DN9359_c0_g1~~TRINITY_DN9359_c0_g1_i1.p2  ORF type:complete len:65 (-),score=7.72 TRINITY_DN9359_c0_g1_i1:210-404(-)
MSALTEVLTLEREPSAVYRALVAFGTLTFRDAEAIDMAQSLEVGSTLERLIGDHPDDKNIQRMC